MAWAQGYAMDGQATDERRGFGSLLFLSFSDGASRQGIIGADLDGLERGGRGRGGLHAKIHRGAEGRHTQAGRCSGA